MRAARLFGATEAIRERGRSQSSRTNDGRTSRVLARCVLASTMIPLDVAWAEGRAMTLEQAI